MRPKSSERSVGTSRASPTPSSCSRAGVAAVDATTCSEYTSSTVERAITRLRSAPRVS